MSDGDLLGYGTEGYSLDVGATAQLPVSSPGVDISLDGLTSWLAGLWSNAAWGILTENQKLDIRAQTKASIYAAAGNNTALAEAQNAEAQIELTAQFAAADAAAAGAQPPYQRYIGWALLAGIAFLVLYAGNTFAKVKQALG